MKDAKFTAWLTEYCADHPGSLTSEHWEDIKKELQKYTCTTCGGSNLNLLYFANPAAFNYKIECLTCSPQVVSAVVKKHWFKRLFGK